MSEFNGPDKLSIIVYDPHLDKIHYALVIASGAAAIGRKVTLFFTMSATRALLKSGLDGRLGWASMPVLNFDGDGENWDEHCRERNIATFEELLDACVSMQVRFLVCEMGLRAIQVAREEIRDDVPVEEGGVVTFITDASKNGSIIFI
ncbi:MAG: hypothetical protein CMF69_01595 [Magnetovibrio sp.]|nr:hypothetical protein [Magnetovibrio sp.]|tara:strand:+ start:225 stop:668 length:444 start_codon:yes stop_codon:yes gene_type:complete